MFWDNMLYQLAHNWQSAL